MMQCHTCTQEEVSGTRSLYSTCTVARVQFIVSGLMQLLKARTELTRRLNISGLSYEIFTSDLSFSL